MPIDLRLARCMAHPLATSMALAACFLTEASPAGTLTVLDPHGRLRNGLPVALVGSGPDELLATSGLSNVQVVALAANGTDLDPASPPVIQRGLNIVRVSGLDTRTGEPEAWDLRVWGDTHASLLLRPSLLDVEMLAGGQARLRLAIHPESTSNVAPIGRMRFDTVSISVFQGGTLVGGFRVASVEFDGRTFDLAAQDSGGSLLGDGDCPFILTTDESELDASVAAQLAGGRSFGQADPLVVVSGFALLPDGSASAFFAEGVNLAGPDDFEILALNGPQPCPWQPDPSLPDPPPEECSWKIRPIYRLPFQPPGILPPNPILLPWGDPPSVLDPLACQQVDAEQIGSHFVIRRRSLEASPTRIRGSVHVCINAPAGSAPLETPWVGCPVDSDSGEFMLRRVGACTCDCAANVTGTASFTASGFLDPLGAVEGFGLMTLILPAGVVASAQAEFRLVSIGPGQPGAPPPAKRQASWPASASATVGIGHCSVLIATRTACHLRGKSRYVPHLTNSTVGIDFESSEFQIMVEPVSEPDCEAGPPILTPFTLP